MTLKRKLLLLLAITSLNVHAIKKVLSPQMTFPFAPHSSRLTGVPRNTIYLTFDDGPSSTATKLVLDTLADYGIHGTFFMVGRMAKAHPELVAQVRREGHRIGNHSYFHKFNFSTQQDFINSLRNTDDQIRSYIYRSDTLLFRSPGGVWNNWRMRTGNGDTRLRKYVGPIYWNAGGGNPQRDDDADWKCWSKRVSISKCRKSYIKEIYSNYRRGHASIVLMHDINHKSAQMLAEILRELSQGSVQWNYDLIENIPAVQDMTY